MVLGAVGVIVGLLKHRRERFRRGRSAQRRQGAFVESRRGGRQTGDAPCMVQRRRAHLRVGQHLQQEAGLVQPVRAMHAGRQQHVARQRVADSAMHQGGFARRHGEAQLRDRRPELGRGTGQANIAATRDLQPRAHAGALDLRDHGQCAIEHRGERGPDLVLVEGAQAGLVEAERGVLGDVAAGAEGAALPAHDDAAGVALPRQRREGLAEFDPHGATHRVEAPGVRQRDEGQRAFAPQRDLPGHSSLAPEVFTTLLQRLISELTKAP